MFYFWLVLAAVLGLVVGYGLFFVMISSLWKFGVLWIWLSFTVFLFAPPLATSWVAFKFHKESATVIAAAGFGFCVSLLCFILMASSGQL